MEMKKSASPEAKLAEFILLLNLLDERLENLFGEAVWERELILGLLDHPLLTFLEIRKILSTSHWKATN